ncbi:MAG: HAD family hydrolase [Alphaproteobacteria bacterium]|nr:HAD family hydrolase [Alphaproteobacteria bacterium]MBV9370523.1 HAD family hydrolase [Alphaproteobacteria bacterium]MBV9901424.1 HAD family hydrolase [Alphaproteobacteria bacterium]
MPIRLICLDADDTLWHNEAYFQRTRARLCALLEPWAEAAAVEARLDSVEHRNLPAYGYGAKGFVLSMAETAIEVSGGAVPGSVVADILALGKAMLAHPVEMLDGVAEALDALADRGRLVLVTKGDLSHQEAKLAASGLGERFTGVEIVSDKKAATYARVFERYGARPEEAVMAGNSMRSDVLPALEAGAWAAFVPFELAWAHEAAEAPVGHPRYRELASLAALPEWIDSIA